MKSISLDQLTHVTGGYVHPGQIEQPPNGLLHDIPPTVPRDYRHYPRQKPFLDDRLHHDKVKVAGCNGC